MKKIYIFLVVVGFGLLLSHGCNNSSNKPSNGKIKIKVGAILPLTGKYADLGNWAKVGLLFAAEDLGKLNSNYEYSVLIEDAKSEPKEAIAAYNKLRSIDKVNIVITTSSALSLAIKPIAIKDSILFFSIASHPEITANNNGRIFRPCNTSVEEGEEISTFVINNFDTTMDNSFILYHNSEFGLSFNSQISKNLGNNVIGSVPYDDNPESLKTIALKAINKKPKVIIAIGFTPNLGILIKTLREANYEGSIVCNIGFSTPSVLEASGNAAKGVHYVDYKLPNNSDHFIQIDSLSQQSYNTNFASISFLSYFTLKLLNYSVTKTNSTDVGNIADFLVAPQMLELDGMKMTTHSNGDILPILFVNQFK
ncbi:MAG: ABC transporter substrate-binding protein [Bacteroidia bacterium]|nr:ABC transporter substrate-binding protein [Bacteroidia bacterium]